MTTTMIKTTNHLSMTIKDTPWDGDNKIENNYYAIQDIETDVN
jgi:hypothetical protein